MQHTRWRMHSFDFALSVTALNTHEKERQMIGRTYDAQAKMRSGKLKRVTTTKRPDDWKQQRRKQRRIKEREKENRYGNISRRS